MKFDNTIVLNTPNKLNSKQCEQARKSSEDTQVAGYALFKILPRPKIEK